jgi:hypothetical protein
MVNVNQENHLTNINKPMVNIYINIYSDLYLIFQTGGRYEFESRSLCDKVCHRLAAGRWFSPGPPVSSINKTDRHSIPEILLKVVLNTINQENHLTNINKPMVNIYIKIGFEIS